MGFYDQVVAVAPGRLGVVDTPFALEDRAGQLVLPDRGPVLGEQEQRPAEVVPREGDVEVVRAKQEQPDPTGAYRPFFPHQTSHWIGLDVHDPGDYARAPARGGTSGRTVTARH